jgi:hypothetical protein
MRIKVSQRYVCGDLNLTYTTLASLIALFSFWASSTDSCMAQSSAIYDIFSRVDRPASHFAMIASICSGSRAFLPPLPSILEQNEGM